MRRLDRKLPVLLLLRRTMHRRWLRPTVLDRANARIGSRWDWGLLLDDMLRRFCGVPRPLPRLVARLLTLALLRLLLWKVPRPLSPASIRVVWLPQRIQNMLSRVRLVLVVVLVLALLFVVRLQKTGQGVRKAR